MDVVMGNNGNVARLNVAHEVRRYVAGKRRIPDVKPGFTPDVKSGFVPVVPVASGLSPTTLKWDPSRRPSAKIGGEGGRSRR